MANEMIGMFGQSPEMTQLGLQQGRDAEMAQLAQMSKGSMLAYGAGTAADRLGGAVGGMLGGTDPRMEEANLDKQIQQEVMAEVQQLGIDPTKDWEKFGTIAAQKYNAAGKPDKAFQISQAIEKMKATQADTSLKNAQAAKALREPSANLPTIAKLQGYRQQLVEQVGEEHPAVKQIDAVIEKEGHIPDQTKVVTSSTGVRLVDTKGNEIQNYGLPQQAGNTNVSFVEPPDKALNYLQGMRSSYNTEVAPFKKELDKVNTAIDIAKQAGDNALASKVLPNVLADIYGGSQKAVSEINRLSTLGSLDERVAQRIVSFLSGSTTDVQIKEILPVLNAAKNLKQGQIKQVEGQYRNIPGVDKYKMDFITGSSEQAPSAPTKAKIPMPDKLSFNNAEPVPVTKNTFADTVLKSTMSKKEKADWLNTAKDNGWID